MLAVELAVTVEPTIWTGSWVVMLPELAVSVAVRLALLVVPEVRVKVAVPVGPVVTVCEPRIPVVVARFTTTSAMAAFVEESAETVTVVGVELSEGIVAGTAES